jgi:hypothetical protein
MARVRGGNTGFAVALVIFGCGFVISLLVAIIFYTKIEEAKAAEVAAQDTLADFITSSETIQANDFKSNEGTVFTTMLNRIRDLETDLREANEQVASLQRQTTEMDNQARTLVTAKEEVEAERLAETQRYRETMEERKASVDSALRDVAALNKQLADLQKKLNDSLKNADEAAQQRIAELTEQVQGFEAEKFDLETQLASAMSEVKRLIDERPKPVEPNTTSPDAQVASVFGEGNDLFINVGKRDGVVMGMTFEVFEPDPVIRLATTGEARGKATIEVYGLQDDAATCRVVRRDRGVNINPGDPVVNLAYDPNLTIRMFAFGTFDIENDGGTNDIGRIEAIIKESGAELVEVSKTEAGIPILTPEINYIVLGAKPAVPDKPAADDFDPVKLAEYQAQLAANEAYFRILDEAKILRIPVLNEDRFLDLVGYYER